MCSVPPPVPPPPPPLAPNPQTETKSTSKPTDVSSNAYQLLSDDPTLCEWASSDPELRRACILNRVCVNKPPFKYKHTKFEPIIQIGPTCGLVALSMLVDGKVTPDEIMNLARQEGYTNNGEMFSCKNMVELGKKVFSLADIPDGSFSIDRDILKKDTVNDLLEGAILLVAYDADVNHAPTTRNGHTAHWGIVCGVVITEELTSDCLDNVYVLCRHGKSRFVYAWSLTQLAESNNNLWEFSPKKQNDGLVYIIPEGGMGGQNGLRGQYITVKRK